MIPWMSCVIALYFVSYDERFAAAHARGYRFIHVTRRMTQPRAIGACNDLGGHLASIYSQAEHDAAAYLVNPVWCPHGWAKPRSIFFLMCCRVDPAAPVLYKLSPLAPKCALSVLNSNQYSSYSLVLKRFSITKKRASIGPFRFFMDTIYTQVAMIMTLLYQSPFLFWLKAKRIQTWNDGLFEHWQNLQKIIIFAHRGRKRTYFAIVLTQMDSIFDASAKCASKNCSVIPCHINSIYMLMISRIYDDINRSFQRDSNRLRIRAKRCMDWAWKNEYGQMYLHPRHQRCRLWGLPQHVRVEHGSSKNCKLH